MNCHYTRILLEMAAMTDLVSTDAGRGGRPSLLYMFFEVSADSAEV
jgi:hypothetical protein